jgi:hypothetical protein
MSAETADHEAELEKLCAGLEAHMGQANMQDVLRDANEAARLLREMAAENERLKAIIRAQDKWVPKPFCASSITSGSTLTKGKPHD